MKRFVLVLLSLPILFLCEPLDRYHPEQYDFLNPSITVNLSQSDFWDGDTVSADTVRLAVTGNELSHQPSYFRRLLDEGEWSDWASSDTMSYRIKLSELSEGEHTLTIEVCYDPQGMIVDSTITFYRAIKPDVTIAGNADSSFEVGSPCTLRVAAAGTGNLGFTWYHDSTLIESATKDSLIIPSVTSADAGVYHCVVTNAWGAETSPDIRLQVLYRIIYHGNENTGGEAPVDTNVYDSEMIARILENSGALTRRGYTFGGWKPTPDGSGASPDSVIGFETATENVTFYAWWIPNSTHIVRFDANGATWEEATDTALQFRTGELMVIPDNSGRMVNPGATFTGWNTMPDGSGTQYSDRDELEMLDEDITLYAQWTQATKTHRVTYNRNGADSGEVPVDTSKYRTGDTVTVLGNSGNLRKEGNTFIGWNSAEQGDAGNVFAPDATFVMGTEDVILYARWTTEPTYSLTYHGNGNDGGTIPEVTYHTRNTLVTVADQGTLSRVGYLFNGWSTNADHTLGEDVQAGASFTIPDHNVTLFARWTVNRYTITYNGNGSTGGSVPDQVTADYHTSVTIAGGGTMERAGYTFDGWNTASDGTGTGYSAETSLQVGTENIKLFAQWKPGLFTVIFEKNHEDATGEMAPQTIACDATARLSSNRFERSGFAFVGWSLQPEGAIAYTNGAGYTMGPKNVTLYAKWADNFKTVTFVKNDNDATGEMAPQNIPANTTLLLSANAFEKYGWTFTGWSLTADGDVAYGDEGQFTIGTENVTLYAKWQKETMLIAFAASAGSGNESVASPAPAITVTVNRRPGSGDTYSVNYTVSGTASAGTDYTLDNGTLSFDAATTSRTIPLGIIDDAIAESDETVIITLSAPSQDAALGERNTCTYTIVDNDLAAVTIQSSAGSGLESAVNQTIVVSLSPSLPNGQTGSVDYAVTGGTATGNGIDYTLAGGTLHFNSSISSLTIPFEVVNDILNEANETVIITLSNPVNLMIGTNATYTYTITDNDPPIINFTSSGGSGSESSVSPSPAITVTASPTPRSGETFSVSYTVSVSSTATGGDYTLAGNILNFDAGNPARTVPLSIINDDIAETSETVVITLSNPTGGAVLGTRTTFTYTINDDETPAIWFENASGSGVESEQDPSAAITVTVNPAPPAGSTISVDYTLSNSSTATGGGTDYTLSGGSLTFTSTTTAQTIPLLISSDDVAEADETVVITLENPTGGAVLGTPSEFTYTIIDDDRTVSIASVTGSPSESGLESQTSSSFIISVVPPPENGQSYTVDYAVTGGTATGGGTDYILVNGTLSFDAANPNRTVQFTVNDDGTAEADETIVISLSNPSQGITPGAQNTFTYTIMDNDRTVSFTSSARSASESVSSPVITVALSSPLSGGQTGSVQYAVTGGTATGGGTDYTLSSGSLTFTPTTTAQTIPLLISSDDDAEADETVVITLQNPTGGAVLGTPSEFTYTIIDDDRTVSIASVTGSPSESGLESQTSSSFIISVVPPPENGQSYTVDYAVTGGTATGGGTDYTLVNGTLSFDAANPNRTVQFTVNDDGTAEADETIVISLSNPSQGITPGAQNTFTYTIMDNDRTVSFTSSAGSASESVSSPAITVAVSPAFSGGQTGSVQYAVTGGTATGNNTDYTLAVGTLSFNASNSTRTVPLVINNDALNEANETVIITLSNPVNVTLGTNVTYTYTISDNDPVAITFSTSAGSGSESVSPPSPAITVTASPTPRSGQTFSVSYTVSGTATGSGTDYTLANGTLSFDASNITRTLPLTIVNDAIAETNETVVITLSSPTNGAVLGTQTTFTYTIVDNETAVVSFSGQTGSGLESMTSSTPIIIVTCSPAPGSGLTPAVNYTVTGTATGGGIDYTLASSGTITFTESSPVYTIYLPITSDEIFESDETVIITLSNPSGCELGSNTVYTHTITNDDVGTIAYVDQNAVGLFTGASWEHAFRCLQDALAKANQPGSIIQEIHVAQGTYFPDETYGNPDGTDERISTFALINDVNLLGGYPSGGGTRNSDPLTNGTILSGNIDYEHGNNDLDGNAYHVVTGANCIIDGFTITRGNADYYQTEDQGGGLLVNVSITQTVNNCRFLENSAYNGDGVCIRGGRATFAQCTFELNKSISLFGSGCLFIGNYWDGVSYPGNASVTGSRFINNSIGGGIFFEGNLLKIDGVVFEGNSGYSGAIHSTGTTIVINQSTFTNNTSTEGGSVRLLAATAQSTITGCTFSETPGSSGVSGMYFRDCSGTNHVTGTAFNSLSGYAMNIEYSGRGTGGPVIIDDCTFNGNRGGALSAISSAFNVTKSDFTNNSSTYDGGAVYITGMNNQSDFDKCTFLSNTARYGGAFCYANCAGINSVTNSAFLNNSSTRGGAVYLNYAAPNGYTGNPVQLVNCTFSKNTSSTDGGGIYFGPTSRLDIVNSILWDNTGSNYPDIYYNSATTDLSVSFCDIQQGGFAGTNHNIHVNPGFCNPQASLPIHLKLEGPNECSNGANIDLAPPDDIEGRLRGNQPSLGAYQYHSPNPCQ